MDFTRLEDTFIDIGGQFITSAFDLQRKLKDVKGLLFDWDGVFNGGRKGLENSSDFSEIDSMGINMLRFGFYNAFNGLQLKTGIVSGRINSLADVFAKRESFHAVYTECKFKQVALEHFCNEHKLDPSQVIFFYDDILDLEVAEKAGIRLAVGRLCNPVLHQYIEKNHLADYISSCQGHENAIREFCEMLLCLLEQDFNVIEKRAMYHTDYQKYLEGRSGIETSFYNCGDNTIKPKYGSEITFKR